MQISFRLKRSQGRAKNWADYFIREASASIFFAPPGSPGLFWSGAGRSWQVGMFRQNLGFRSRTFLGNLVGST